MRCSFNVSPQSAVWFLLWAQFGSAGIAVAQAPQATDWPQFGWDVASSGASQALTGINRRSLASLVRHQIQIDGTVDSSVIYLHAVTVNGSTHDVFFMTTTYGKTIALDASNSAVLWEYTPSEYSSWAGTNQITTSTPAADPDRQHIYAAAPDGSVRKLAISNGQVVWTTAITLLPRLEKIASPLKVFNGRIIAVTGGYIGDAPPYQGHVAILDAQSGHLLQVWNSLCSNRAGLIDPASCTSTRSAIWGRAGAVIDPATGNIFVATGNGPYNGSSNWGDSIIELSADATRMLGNYTPADNSRLDEGDVDLGSTSPVLLSPGIVAQGGKDGLIRTLKTESMSGTAPRAGGELQIIPTPSSNLLFTAPAVWNDNGQTWMFAADQGGTAAWAFSNGTLTKMWSNSTGGTSPVVAGGLLYIYNPHGDLYVYDPVQGTELARLTSGSGHWNSPIVVDRRIVLPEGNANDHATSGVLDVWTARGFPRGRR
ncbi:MAG TPA: PQQ-binding-like beta-propeller repeat protein [Bryobacteraceae bacterium]|nr:PQQ-binding-like beta-propeller repeat protein [Bryobacteraceae bacterium]